MTASNATIRLHISRLLHAPSSTDLATYMALDTIKYEECPDSLLGPVFDGRDVIPWYRINDFQLIGLKMLAEQLLLGCPQGSITQKGHDSIGLFIPGELPLQKLALRRIPVVYASPHNPGALAVAKDLTSGMGGHIKVTNDTSIIADPKVITHFLLYLNDQTWVQASGAKLIEEIRRAIAANSTVNFVLVHENDQERGGCDFGIFFDGRTPSDLRVELYKVRARLPSPIHI